MREDKIFWKNIFAPVIVGIPPLAAVRDLCVCENSAIRHYGKMMVGDEVKKVYLESMDMGLSWKTHPQLPDDPGAMEKCPWADYFLKLEKDPLLTAIRSRAVPVFQPIKS